MWPSGSPGQVTNKKQKKPRGIRPCRCCPFPRVQNVLWSLKIRALTCVGELEDTMIICLAEKKPEVWASDHQKKNKKSPRGIRPRRCCPSPRVPNILRSLKIRALTCVVKDAASICSRPSENRRSGVSDHHKKQETPHWHWTPPFFSSS